MQNICVFDLCDWAVCDYMCVIHAGLNVPGIFRIAGSKSRVTMVRLFLI